jgi:hypothetical protein
MGRHILMGNKAVNPQTFKFTIKSYCGFEIGVDELDAVKEWLESQQTEGTCKECLREEKKFKLKQLRKK